MCKKPVVLILSGIDPTNGAGLGRDILTVKETGCYPLSVPTVLTSQNSMEFQSSTAVDANYIRSSVKLLQKEFSIRAVKTGLVPTDDKWIEEFAELLKQFSVPIVIDTVVKATTDNMETAIPGSYLKLINGNNRIITPNLRELKNIHMLTFSSQDTPEKMAANISKKLKCTVLTTFEGTESFITLTQGKLQKNIRIELINSQNSYHGTGCTFSSALASFLASDFTLTESVRKASGYTGQKITSALKFTDKGQHFPY